jgi:uridine phosphorylase
VPDTIAIHPTATLAERVVLPGDPGRALLLSQSLLSEPKMFNHNRGLWGYTGAGTDGRPLTIQSSGMGGPSAAIVAGELHRLGARRLVQVGTCAALDPGLELGQLLIAERTVAGDGTSRSLGAGAVAEPDAGLLARLSAAAAANGQLAARRCMVASSDLLYEDLEGPEAAWLSAGAVAVEMEAATLFTLARRRGFEAASVLIVAGQLTPRRRMAPEALLAAEERAGALAAAALA